MNKRGGALDLEDVDGRAHGNDHGLVIGTRGPDLPADADPAALGGDLLEHQGGPADQRGCAGPQQRGLLDVAHRDRPDHAEPGAGRDGERGQLEREAKASRAGDSGHRRGCREQAECQRRREDLGDSQHRGEDQPENPGPHGHSRDGCSSGCLRGPAHASCSHVP